MSKRPYPIFLFEFKKNTIVDIIYNELVRFLQFSTSAILLETILTLLSEQYLCYATYNTTQYNVLHDLLNF